MMNTFTVSNDFSPFSRGTSSIAEQLNIKVQGNVTTDFRWGGSVCFCLFRSLSQNWKKYWNRAMFAKVM